MSEYALVKSGKVQNVIVADSEFAALIAADWDAVIVRTNPCEIGFSYAQTIFVSQPQSQEIATGNPVTFSVVASGGIDTLKYQWKKGVDDILNATDSTYSIESVASGDAGDYSCVVYDGTHSVQSDVATLTVL